MTTTPKYEVHPLAQIFPEIEGSAFEALVEDIKERRQQEPAWLYEGKILDGKNRYRACEQLGFELRVREFIGNDPVGFVLSANLHRRHLDTSQRAMVAASLANLKVGMGRVASFPRGVSPTPLPKRDAYALLSKSGSLAMFAAITFSSQGKTARAKPSAQLDLLPSSSETDHHCSRSVFAALGSCPRHKKVPPLHPAGVRHQDGFRPDPVCVS